MQLPKWPFQQIYLELLTSTGPAEMHVIGACVARLTQMSGIKVYGSSRQC